MKLVIITVLAAFSTLPSFSLAEGNSNHDWAEEAALKYEKKAVEAAKDGNDKAAGIYTRMAEIKREAGLENFRFN